jgi:hypothetical protein
MQLLQLHGLVVNANMPCHPRLTNSAAGIDGIGWGRICHPTVEFGRLLANNWVKSRPLGPANSSTLNPDATLFLFPLRLLL